MADITLEQVWQLVEQLSPKDQDVLLTRLQIKLPHKSGQPVTLETIMRERQRRLASGESKSGLPSLRNAYAEPQFDLTDNELRDGIKGFANEWEQELDDLRPEN